MGAGDQFPHRLQIARTSQCHPSGAALHADRKEKGPPGRIPSMVQFVSWTGQEWKCTIMMSPPSATVSPSDWWLASSAWIQCRSTNCLLPSMGAFLRRHGGFAPGAQKVLGLRIFLAWFRRATLDWSLGSLMPVGLPLTVRQCAQNYLYDHPSGDKEVGGRDEGLSRILRGSEGLSHRAPTGTSQGSEWALT